jgi:hypothetical protein
LFFKVKELTKNWIKSKSWGLGINFR